MTRPAGRTGDHYQLHRAALAPLLPGATSTTLKAASAAASASGELTFQQFLLEQGLGSLWSKKIQSHTSTLPFSPGFRNQLHQAHLHATGGYLVQRAQLSLTRDLLHNARIPHVVFKGADTRERYYDDPAVRPAADIDILVAPQDKLAAIKTLRQHGFLFHAEPSNISHEVSLVKKSTTIDLHWDIMRPGRTRVPMVRTLLASRVDCGDHWGMSVEGNLFLMLVHPVFTKYSTAPQAALVHLLDLVYLLEKSEPDWDRVCAWLAATGLKTCGWITLSCLRMLTGIEAKGNVRRRLQPGKLRTRYLNNWLEKNLSSRLLAYPALVKAGFTLAAHDRPGDAIAAVTGLQRSTCNGAARCLELQALSA